MGDAWNVLKWLTPAPYVGLSSGIYYQDKDKSSDGSQSVSASASASVDELGKVSDVGSIEAQAAQRRLARLSKYFTSPTGVLDSPTGSAGVF